MSKIELMPKLKLSGKKRLVKLNKTVDPMTFLNFIPPLWPGFIVDAVTGAMMKYEAEVVHLNFNTNEYQLTRSRN